MILSGIDKTDAKTVGIKEHNEVIKKEMRKILIYKKN